MDEIDGARIKGLTIASIVIGGFASIVSGGVGLAGGATIAGDAANVGGGALASLFGVTALFTHSEVEFRHERNIMKELWEDPPHPRIFPRLCGAICIDPIDPMIRLLAAHERAC